MNPLVELTRSFAQDLKPIPTQMQRKLSDLDGIKCVLFDVYGTLMVSGVGDISHSSDDDRDTMILQELAKLGIDWKSKDSAGAVFKSIILAHQQHVKETGIEYPDIDIREVWTEFLKGIGENTESDEIEELSIRFESQINPTAPMPFSEMTYCALNNSGIRMGIVSNAQFFTPLLFEAYLGETLNGFGFEDDLCQWSYSHKEAKPSTTLYRKNALILESKYGVRPEEVIYVGNDMLNDIAPAQSTGFKTALFAGDKRSLRLREDDERTSGVVPDLIIHNLDELIECVIH